MDESNEHWMLGSGSYCINSDVDAEDLLNDAAEWLEYARAITRMLSESVNTHGMEGHERRRRMLRALQAVDMLTLMASHCAVHAHARMSMRIPGLVPQK